MSQHNTPIADSLGLDIDYKNIAEGLLDIMHEEDPAHNDRVRLGLLPAKLMEHFEGSLPSTLCTKMGILLLTCDERTVIIRREGLEPKRVTFSMKKLVAEISHCVVCCLFAAVDMVV